MCEGCHVSSLGQAHLASVMVLSWPRLFFFGRLTSHSTCPLGQKMYCSRDLTGLSVKARSFVCCALLHPHVSRQLRC